MSYKYGLLDIKTIDVTLPIFGIFNTKIILTNELFKCDPVVGKVKFLYDCNNNIICQEGHEIPRHILTKDVSFVRINVMGGLGNVMFQIATAYAYAKRTSRTLYVTGINNIAHTTCKYPFLEKYECKNECKNDNLVHHHEKGALTYTEINNYKTHNVELHGYFQSEKYFDTILVQDAIFSEINSLYTGKYNGLGKCFIHVRRGDYVNHWLHYIDLTKYFKKAIEYVKSQYQVEFYVFSDDNKYCEQSPIFNKFTIINGLNEMETMSLMTQCQYGGICSNSTFSWWGVYLNQSPTKMSIFPSKWFNDSTYIKDIYPKNSIVINI